MAGVSIKTTKRSVVLKNRFYELVLDLSNGTWSAMDRTTKTWAVRNAGFRLDKAGNELWKDAPTAFTCTHSAVETAFGNGTTLRLTATPEAGYEPERILTIRLYAKQPFIELGWGVRNKRPHPIRIENAELLHQGELFSGQSVERPRVLRSGAGADVNVVEKGWEIEALNGALLTYKNRGVRRSIVAGGLAYAEFGRRVEFLNGKKFWGARGRVRMADIGFRNMTLACWDPQGKRVAPGDTYMSPDSMYLDLVTADPFEALEAYGRALRTANRAAPNTYDFPTLCGWMVSTTSLGEGKPINNAPGLVEQTQQARERGFMNYSPLAVRLEPDTYCRGNYGDTQQGWWDDAHWAMHGPGGGHAPHAQPGSLREPYETFAKFCTAVSKLGGIPFTYFQTSMPSNDFALAHPEWMLNNDISRLHVSHAHHRPLVRYDYSDPGFRAHCLKVWKRLRKAGMRGIKFDYPETAWAKDGGFEDPAFTTTAAYREPFRLCREGLGPDAFLHERNLGGPTHESAPLLDATAGIVDIQRVWGDASHFEPEMASRMGLRWYKSRTVFLYYPDGKSFVHNGTPIAAYKRRAFLTLIAFLSGRLEIGTSIGSMTDEMFHDTTRLYPMLGGDRSPRPVDMLVAGAHPEVYAYTVADGWQQVLLINNGKRTKTVSTPLSGDQADTGSLGLDAAARYHAFDFWTQSYLGAIKGSGSLSMSLRGGEAAMISVRKVEPHPQVLSTNRHIMQGMMDSHGIRWSKARQALSGKVDCIAGEDFVLSVACNGRKPDACKGATIRKRGKGLIDLVFEAADENAQRAFQLRFAAT